MVLTISVLHFSAKFTTFFAVQFEEKSCVLPKIAVNFAGKVLLIRILMVKVSKKSGHGAHNTSK